MFVGDTHYCLVFPYHQKRESQTFSFTSPYTLWLNREEDDGKQKRVQSFVKGSRHLLTFKKKKKNTKKKILFVCLFVIFRFNHFRRTMCHLWSFLFPFHYSFRFIIDTFPFRLIKDCRSIVSRQYIKYTLNIGVHLKIWSWISFDLFEFDVVYILFICLPIDILVVFGLLVRRPIDSLN
jgi:hypothetical protein